MAQPKGGGTAIALYTPAVKSTPDVGGMTLANGRLYWSMNGAGWNGTAGMIGIWTVRTDGSDLRQLTTWPSPTLQADGSYLHWSRYAIERSCL